MPKTQETNCVESDSSDSDATLSTKSSLLRKAFFVSVALVVVGFATFVLGLAASGGFTPPTWSLRIPEIGIFMMIAGALSNTLTFCIVLFSVTLHKQFGFWQAGSALLFTLTVGGVIMALRL